MMLREKPPLSDTAIALRLEEEYGVPVDAVTFLPIGYDPHAAVYRIRARNQADYFLKITRSAIVPASLRIPRALIERGVTNVLAPLRTQRGALWCTLHAYSLILYPFINGENAMERGMSDQQWKTFGATLNAIHSSGIESRFAGEIPVETFATPMINLVREMRQRIRSMAFNLPVQQQFAAFWEQHAPTIQLVTDRAEALGRRLQTETFDAVLCHGDIHAANIMLDHEGNLYVVDWDTPRVAPRERDLLFVVGSVIARRVTPHEEACFFQGYGEIAVHREALTYYRYERALEDLYAGAQSVFFNPLASDAVKESDAQLCMGLFQPGDIVESALAGDTGLAR